MVGQIAGRGRGSLLPKEVRDREREKRKVREPWERKGLTRLGRVVAFLQALPITKGIMAGRNMKLIPDQLEFLQAIYGEENLQGDGRRKVALGIKSMPKGNGKTGFCAGLALCHLMGPEAEPRGEIYSAATDREQAGIMFNEMEAILRKRPRLAVRVNAQRFMKKIEVLEGVGEGSVYQALSADAKKAHGLAPSLWVYDELAQAEDRTLLDNLIEGMGKRREALGLIISTQARSDDHPLSELMDDGLVGEDESTHVQLITVPPDENVFDDEVLKQYNPAWGAFLDVDDLLRSKARAQRMPGFEPAFRNLRCNQRVDAGSEKRLISAPQWKLLQGPVNLRRLEGRRCFGGLDLSGKHDLSALLLAFPADGLEPVFEVLPVFWTPLGQLENRRDRERRLFEKWIKDGHLIGVPGKVIRFHYIAKQLKEFHERYDIVALGYDRWRIDDLKADLEDENVPIEGPGSIPLEPFGQGFRDMGPAIEYLAELALTSRLRHNGHPVLTSNVANAVVVSDPAGNQKIDKAKSQRRATSRIDGAVALVQALGTARRFKPEKGGDMSDFLSNMVAA